tara:strand:+ start:631 stop:897 length:267 start_codon:yes stop_codon:yes gene_type:complete
MSRFRYERRRCPVDKGRCTGWPAWEKRSAEAMAAMAAVEAWVTTQAAARAVVTEAVTAMAAEAMPMDGRERGGGDRMLGRGAERRRLE